LVADEFATTSGEDRRATGETCTLLLASPGRRTSDAAAVRGDAGSYRAAADRNGIERAQQAKSVNRVVKEEVLHKWAGCAVTSPAMVRIIDGWERRRWNTVQKYALEKKQVYNGGRFPSKKGNSR